MLPAAAVCCMLYGNVDVVLARLFFQGIKEVVLVCVDEKCSYNRVAKHGPCNYQLWPIYQLLPNYNRKCSSISRNSGESNGHGAELGCMEGWDIHIHFPVGAVPKDGPLAGVTLVTALVSLLSKKRMRADTAMTGELTLRGLVLPMAGEIRTRMLFFYAPFIM